MTLKSIRFTGGAAFFCAMAGCQSHLSTEGPHGPQCAAIQSAEDIGFSGDRAAELKRIAALPELNEHEQMFLVDATVKHSTFSGDRADVLVELANNPSVTKTTREYMAEQMRDISMFSEDRARVTEAISGKQRK